MGSEKADGDWLIVAVIDGRQAVDEYLRGERRLNQTWMSAIGPGGEVVHGPAVGRPVRKERRLGAAAILARAARRLRQKGARTRWVK